MTRTTKTAVSRNILARRSRASAHVSAYHSWRATVMRAIAEAFLRADCDNAHRLALEASKAEQLGDMRAAERLARASIAATA